MSDFDLTIDRLRLDVSNAAGQEHRIGPIAGRAAAIFAARLAEDDWSPSQPPALDLAGQSDEQAANAIAGEWLRAVALKVGI